MIKDFMLDSALKAQQWEITKGHLRALVALQGSYKENPKWRGLSNEVEVFIRNMEEKGFVE
jgi:hypothetical protein